MLCSSEQIAAFQTLAVPPHDTRDMVSHFEHKTCLRTHRTTLWSGLTRASMLHSHQRLASSMSAQRCQSQKHDPPKSPTLSSVTPTAAQTLCACIPLVESVWRSLAHESLSGTLTSLWLLFLGCVCAALQDQDRCSHPSPYAAHVSPACIPLTHNVWCGDIHCADSYLLGSSIRRSAAALSLLILSRWSHPHSSHPRISLRTHSVRAPHMTREYGNDTA
jgi:hypothetical protein